jgi:hypothetical protein
MGVAVNFLLLGCVVMISSSSSSHLHILIAEKGSRKKEVNQKLRELDFKLSQATQSDADLQQRWSRKLLPMNIRCHYARSSKPKL